MQLQVSTYLADKCEYRTGAPDVSLFRSAETLYVQLLSGKLIARGINGGRRYPVASAGMSEC